MKEKSLIITIIAMLFLFAPFASVVAAEEYSLITRIDFDPKRDGYKFENYPNSSGQPVRDDSNDLDASSLIEMFGEDKVCVPRTATITREQKLSCKLNAVAEKWRLERIKFMRAGHCDGITVTAMRFYLWRYLSKSTPWSEFLPKSYGKTSPEQWQSGAKTVYALNLDNNLAKYIAYYHSLQNLDEVYYPREKFSRKPTEIVQLLIQSFETKEEFYELGIGMFEEGRTLGGHALFPFAVEESKDKKFYRISVYDSNYPGTPQYVTVGKTKETLLYLPSGAKPQDYGGLFKLSKISERFKPKYGCYFCSNNKDAKGAEGSTNEDEKIHFFFSGKGSLLITDPNAQQIGFDPKKKAEVNQIRDAVILYSEGGFSPEYALPYDEAAEKSYQVLISGEDLTKETNADLSVAAPGFVVGFENILLDPKENLTVSISPDGKTLDFTASADGETPELFITTEDGPGNPSYSFKVGGVKIDAGKTLTMTVDIEEGKVYFKDNDGKEDAYDIRFERLNPDGEEIKFVRSDVNLEGRDSYEVDISNWDEETEPCIKDEDGDRVSDENCGSEDDEN